MSRVENVLLKIERATERAETLKQSMAAFCRDHPLIIEACLREGRLGVNLICQMEEIILPLRIWSLELGEIVYSLRSALDNLIYACARVRADPPQRPRDLHFPIIQDARQYANAVRGIAPQLPANIADLLEKIQPYQRARADVQGAPEHDPLVLLNWISNHDKHRMPVLFLIPPREIEFSNSCQFESESDAAANVPPDVVVHVGPLSHGATLLEYRTKHPVRMVSGKLTITAQIAFESHTGMREMTEAINQLTWYTRLVVDEFAKNIHYSRSLTHRSSGLPPAAAELKR